MSIKPGTELDRRIDEVLFGRTFTKFPMGWGYHNGRGWVTAEPYSSTWNGMQLVIEEMQRRGYEFRLGLYETVVAGKWNYWAYFEDELEEYKIMVESTAPHAVCMAALGALEGQEDEA